MWYAGKGREGKEELKERRECLELYVTEGRKEGMEGMFSDTVTKEGKEGVT